MKWCGWILATLFVAGIGWADLDSSYLVPLDHAAIQYASTPVSDPVSRLQARLDQGEAKLAWDAQWGYLPSILKELAVKRESQVLVFSKTSFQAPRIAPRTPRALYFNDEVSVGWVKGGDVVEFAAVDPRQGVIFYTLEQEEKSRPKIERQEQCLQCHASGGTLGVPGMVVRSVYPDHAGMPIFQAGSYISDHRSPLAQRWGGWYVTGTHGSQRHMGNVLVENKECARTEDMGRGANTTDLRDKFDTGSYLTPHSDIVALMILEHQTRMVNLLTRAGFETRMAFADQQAMNKALGDPADYLSDTTKRRISRLVDEVLRYMLFTEEAQLTDVVKGTSGFAESYQASASRDTKGRSLRDLDLHTRLLQYRCSPLIYSAQFDALPDRLREEVYRRLWLILDGKDPAKEYQRLAAAERTAIREILTGTKKGLPAWWKQGTGPA